MISLPQFSLPTLLALGIAALFLVNYIIRRCLLNPLRKLPGSFASIFTNVPHLIQFMGGNFFPHAMGLSRHTGALVRCSPDEVLIGSAEAVDLVFVKLDLPKPPFVYHMLRMPYPELDSVLTFENADKSNGDHRKRRRLVFPAFAPSTLENVEFLVQNHIEDLMERVALDGGITGASPVELVEIFDCLTLDVILDLAFDLQPRTLLAPFSPEGTDPDPIAPSNIRSAVTEGFRFAAARAALSALGINIELISWFIPTFRNGKVALARISEFTEKIVADRRKAAAADKAAPKRMDLLQSLVDSTDEESGYQLTEREVVAEALLFLIAGNETTSSSLAFAAGFLMSDGARAWKRLQEEIENAYAEQQKLDSSDPMKLPTLTSAPHARRLGYSTIRDLPYLNAVITETVRLRPIAGFQLRYNPTPIYLPDGTGREHRIPARTTLNISAAAVSCDPTFWGPDSDQFHPERFLAPTQGGRANRLDPNSHEVRKYLPGFSFGSRNCIGQNLARMQMRLALAHLVLNYNCEGWYQKEGGGLDERTFNSWEGTSYLATMKVKGGKMYGLLSARR